ncbi:hypothetical protein HN51_035599, partial [Arachis hypogaea]
TLDLEEDVDPDGAIDGAVLENCIVERVELEYGLGFNNNKYALYILTEKLMYLQKKIVQCSCFL